MTTRKTSRRVAWPEPGYRDGGEFRLTWGRLVGGITLLLAIAGAVPIYWTISDHWMNRQEITKAMKDHAEHDAGIQAWNQYGFAANRPRKTKNSRKSRLSCKACQPPSRKPSPPRRPAIRLKSKP